jgi:thioredoxin-like negative regulator of GroEL
MAGGVVSVLAAAFGAIELPGYLHKTASAHSVTPAAVKTAAAQPTGTDALDTKRLSDQSDLLDQARNFSQKKEYSKAEDIYRTILKTDPGNTEVKRLLASALFRQDKIDDSVKVLNSIAEDKSSAPPPDSQQ